MPTKLISGQKLMDLCSSEEEGGHVISTRFSCDGQYVITLTKQSVKIWNISKKEVSWSIGDS